MEEKKIVMPPPPKELKNVPPPPPSKQEDGIKEVIRYPMTEPVVEKVEVDIVEKNNEQIGVEKLKNKVTLKTALYWGGFALSLIAVGVIVFVLVK